MIRRPRLRLAPRRFISRVCFARPPWLAPPIQFALVLGSLFLCRFALADIPAPDSCTVPGQPCNNAGPSSNQPGVCTMTSCSRSIPGPDGGLVVMTYNCSKCYLTPSDAGADADAAGPGTGGAGGARVDASASTGGAAGACTRTSGSGCGVVPAVASRNTVAEGWWLGLVAILTLRWRPSVRRRPR